MTQIHQSAKLNCAASVKQGHHVQLVWATACKPSILLKGANDWMSMGCECIGLKSTFML